MTSAEMIEAPERDYQMLKEKGKSGELVLHYHGFLDGWSLGFGEGIECAYKRVETGFNNMLCEHPEITYDEHIREVLAEFQKRIKAL